MACKTKEVTLKLFTPFFNVKPINEINFIKITSHGFTLVGLSA